MSRATGCLLASVAWLAIAGTARTSLAQEPAEPAEAAPAEADVVMLRDLAQQREAQNLDANIEQWVFGGQGAAKTREKLESALTQDIDRFDRKYGLTPAQKKKLELAGRRDLKRFFDRVEDAKAEYLRAKGDWNQVGDGVFELQRMQNQPHSELFGDESMLAKTLKKNLTPEQVARYEKKVYRGRLEWMAGMLHNRLVLRPDQRRRLVDLLADETPPLKRYGSFDYDAIMLQMSRLAPERLRSVLDQSQCRELALRFDQARRMESILVSEGYIARAQPHAGEPKWQHQEVRR
jgi:hypothetical protein